MISVFRNLSGRTAGRATHLGFERITTRRQKDISQTETTKTNRGSSEFLPLLALGPGLASLQGNVINRRKLVTQHLGKSDVSFSRCV